MPRRGLGRWNKFLMGSLAWLALGAGLWWGGFGGTPAFAEGGLSEDVKQKLTTQILTLVGGDAKGFTAGV
jgi:hypothetical protein